MTHNTSSATEDRTRASGVTAGELLPCPFCGGPALLNGFVGQWHIQCKADECFASNHGSHYINEADAVAAWNTRAPAVSPESDARSNSADETTKHSPLTPGEETFTEWFRREYSDCGGNWRVYLRLAGTPPEAMAGFALIAEYLDHRNTSKQ